MRAQFSTKILLLGLIFLTSFNLSAAEPIKFGIFPMSELKTMVRLFAPVAARLESDLNLQVQIVSAPTRNIFNERTINGRYDLVWTCNACYLKAHEKSGLTAIARGGPPFKGVVIVRKDSDINQLKDLKNKKIIAVGRHSIAGFLFLRNRLADLNILESRDVSFTFVGNVESIPFKVHNRSFDAGVFSKDAYFRSVIYDNIKNNLKILASSVDIPQFPFAVKKGMNRSLKLRIQSVLASITQSDPDGLRILEALKFDKIEAANDTDYDEFRELYQKTKYYSKQSNKKKQ